MRVFGILLLYLVMILALREQIDLRDFPGAAATKSIYHSFHPTRNFGTDWVAHVLFYLRAKTTLSAFQQNELFSIFFSSLGLLGGLLSIQGLSKQKVALGILILPILWSMLPYFGCLTGIDTFAFGLTWFLLGCSFWGLKNKWFGLPFFFFGISFLPFAIGLKESVLPLAGLFLWLPFCLPPKHKRSWLWWSVSILGGSYCLLWGYSWFWGASSGSRIPLASFSLETLKTGWFELHRLSLRGMPEGHFIQLFLGAFLFSILQKNGKLAVLSIFSFLLIILITSSLGDLSRPRYLAPLGFSLVIILATALNNWNYKHKRFMLVILQMLFLLDGYTFFYFWSNARTNMVGGQHSTLPKPPDIWLSPYRPSTDITYRDLSLYGGIDIFEMINYHKQAIAVPRLRDDRHISVSAFNRIYGQETLILDPGKCCEGEPVDLACAQKTILAAKGAGYTIALPNTIRGVERVSANDEPWLASLFAVAEDETNKIEQRFWTIIPSERVRSVKAPCLKPIQ